MAKAEATVEELTLSSYKAFLAERRILIAERLNAFLGDNAKGQS